MNKKILFLSTALAFSMPTFAGLPEALMSLEYEQYSSALSEFEKLANEGSAASLYYLGRMYQNGWGVEKDILQAFKYFQSANQAFYLPASGQLGKILLHGEGGIPTDPVLAIELLKRAALGGSSEAAYELGNATIKGIGTENKEPNYNHAFGYYTIAAVKGDKKAQYQLGQMYLSGRGVPQDYQKSLTWIARAANQGYVLAQIELAKIYENDEKLKNLKRAYAWNSVLAAYNSDSVGLEAAKKRDKLALSLQREVLAEQQAIVRAWKPKSAQQSVPEEERLQAWPTIPGFNDPRTLQQILLREGTLPQDGTLYGISMKTIDIAEATNNFDDLTQIVEKAMSNGQTKVAAFYGDVLKNRLNAPKESVQWYEKGAKAGEIYAQYQLAKAYCEGWGDAPDVSKCYAWLLTANEKSDPVLTTPIQQALLTVRENATTEELERGKKEAETVGKKEEKGSFTSKVLDLF